jgi:hypothetical protein
MFRWDTAELKSWSWNVFAAKYYLAILLFVGFGLSSGWWGGWRLLFGLPFAVAGFFQLSLAVVDVKDGILRYRRFIKWTTIHRPEVLSCGLVLPPFVGYIRLNRFVPPWGRLYFVLDRNQASNPFRKGEYALVRCIRNEAAPPPRHTPEPSASSTPILQFQFVAAGTAGVLISLFRIAVSGPTSGRSVLEPARQVFPSSWSMLLRIQFLLATPPAAAAICTIFTILAVRGRHRRMAWVHAFLAGIALPYVFSHCWSDRLFAIYWKKPWT